MARPRKPVEVPGQESTQKNDGAENATDALLLNSVVQTPANTPEQLNAATAGATVIVPTDGGSPDKQETAPTIDLATRNAALSGLNVQGFAVISMFETLNYTDEHGHPLTNSLEFIALVKKATEAVSGNANAPAVQSEDGARKNPGKPVLTEHGWHVPG